MSRKARHSCMRDVVITQLQPAANGIYFDFEDDGDGDRKDKQGLFGTLHFYFCRPFYRPILVCFAALQIIECEFATCRCLSELLVLQICGPIRRNLGYCFLFILLARRVLLFSLSSNLPLLLLLLLPVQINFAVCQALHTRAHSGCW